MGHIVLPASLTPDTRHGSQDAEDGSWPARPLTPVAGHSDGVSHPLIGQMASPGPPMASHWSPQATRTSVRYEATGQLAEDETLKSIPFETGGSMPMKEGLLFSCMFKIDIFGLLNACSSCYYTSRCRDTGQGHREHPDGTVEPHWPGPTGLRSSLSLGSESVSPHLTQSSVSSSETVTSQHRTQQINIINRF